MGNPWLDGLKILLAKEFGRERGAVFEAEIRSSSGQGTGIRTMLNAWQSRNLGGMGIRWEEQRGLERKKRRQAPPKSLFDWAWHFTLRGELRGSEG